MNAIGYKVAREQQHGRMAVDMLDQEMLRELKPRDGDGTHCRGSAIVCWGTLQLLLRLLELGPRDR